MFHIVNICEMPHETIRIMSLKVVYYPTVPAGLVASSAPVSGAILEMPKSDSLATILASRRTLLGFTSRCITGGVTHSCRYSRPRAESKAIRIRVSQSRTGGLPDAPETYTYPQVLIKL